MSGTPRGTLPSVIVYTDGGADPNPGPGGWGAVLVHPASGKVQELKGGEPQTTNNRMELTAAISALEGLRQPCRVELHTDSQYLRRGVSEWLPGWIARGWRRKGGELQNEDLWRRLAAAAARHEVDWRWVKGHAGDARNERADRLATAAIREQRVAAGLAPGGGPRPEQGVEGEEGAPGGKARTNPSPDFEVFLRVSMTPRGGGWAALVRRAGEAGPAGAGDGAAAPAAAERVLRGGLPPGAAATSNALDLAAAAAAIEALPEGAAAAVYTVSDYLRYGASRWLPGWRGRGWKTREGGQVLNRPLWERLAAAMAARQVSWPEVKGREIEELERLASIAKTAALAAQGAAST